MRARLGYRLGAALASLALMACSSADEGSTSVTDDLGVAPSEPGADPRKPATASPAAPAPGAPINADNPKDPGSMYPPPGPFSGGSGGGGSPTMAGLLVAWPEYITLDGSTIDAGTLTLQDATAFTVSGGNVYARDVLGGQPVDLDLYAGSSQVLWALDLPVGTAALNLVGTFTPTSPSGASTFFAVTLFGAIGQEHAFTLYLPSETGGPCAQVTGLGSSSGTGDNQDLFAAGMLTSDDIAYVLQSSPVGLPDFGSWPIVDLPSCPTSWGMQGYATVLGGGPPGG